MATKRHTVTILDSDDRKYVGYHIIELHEGDTYIFPDGRVFNVLHITSTDFDKEIYQSNDYWVKVKSDEIVLF